MVTERRVRLRQLLLASKASAQLKRMKFTDSGWKERSRGSLN
jgi:hypothetical protein